MSTARAALQDFFHWFERTEGAACFLEALDSKPLFDGTTDAMREELTGRIMPALLKEPSFRGMVDQDKALMWRYLDV